MQRVAEGNQRRGRTRPNRAGLLPEPQRQHRGTLQRHPCTGNLDCWGADRSKRLISYAITSMPTHRRALRRSSGRSMAYAMKLLRRVRDYYVILHGIEHGNRYQRSTGEGLMGAKKIIATTRYTAEECGRHNAIPAGGSR